MIIIIYTVNYNNSYFYLSIKNLEEWLSNLRRGQSKQYGCIRFAFFAIGDVWKKWSDSKGGWSLLFVI